MKIRATKRYVDKYTKKIIEAGAIMNNVSIQRVEELEKQNVIEIIQEKKAVSSCQGDKNTMEKQP